MNAIHNGWDSLRSTFDSELRMALSLTTLLFKFSYSTLLIYIILAAYTSPRSAAARMVEENVVGGSIAIGALCMFCLLMMMDIFFNHIIPLAVRGLKVWRPSIAFTPIPYQFEFARANLHYIYALAGGFCLIPIFVSSHTGLAPPSSTFLYVRTCLVGVFYSLICAKLTGARRTMEAGFDELLKVRA